MQNLFAEFNLWAFHLPIPLALAVIATLGYLAGRWSRKADTELITYSKRELRHAQAVAAELERITWDIRKSLSKHHANVSRFKDRVNRLGDQHEEATWKELCREAEDMLKPTLKLATQIANAYEEIRQQGANLMKFTEVRTDPLTRVKNRRALDDALAAQFALISRYGTPFSVVMFDIDQFKRINDEQGHLNGDKILQDLARLLDDQVRETDMVARYGGDEFVVIMPQTDLDVASILGERLRARIQDNMSVTVSGGVSEAQKSDTKETLLTRADVALYQAKSSGRNLIFRNDGQDIAQIAHEEALITS